MKRKESILACFLTVTVLLLFIYIVFELIGVEMNGECCLEKIIIFMIIFLLLVLVGILAGQCLFCPDTKPSKNKDEDGCSVSVSVDNIKVEVDKVKIKVDKMDFSPKKWTVKCCPNCWALCQEKSDPSQENPSPSQENPSPSQENPSSSQENPFPCQENPSPSQENPFPSQEKPVADSK